MRRVPASCPGRAACLARDDFRRQPPVACGDDGCLTGHALDLGDGEVITGGAGKEVEDVRHARRTGMSTALTFLAVGPVCVPRRRIPAAYLMDAVKEAAWLAVWWTARSPTDG
ncbi:hypothetical protein [Streptomyces katrae]|uniref:hypothetical protein n=1 Tax=Streptomyces katrae TaxID=68223 RepID=UPI000B2949E3|nr:hypothetical protein [Streptomyces katrae]